MNHQGILNGIYEEGDIDVLFFGFYLEMWLMIQVKFHLIEFLVETGDFEAGRMTNAKDGVNVV